MAGCMICDYDPDNEVCAECGCRSDCAEEAAYEEYIDMQIDLYREDRRGE